MWVLRPVMVTQVVGAVFVMMPRPVMLAATAT
jgi:hypothetical protein